MLLSTFGFCSTYLAGKISGRNSTRKRPLEDSKDQPSESKPRGSVQPSLNPCPAARKKGFKPLQPTIRKHNPS
jgi:hypothetical protein